METLSLIKSLWNDPHLAAEVEEPLQGLVDIAKQRGTMQTMKEYAGELWKNQVKAIESWLAGETLEERIIALQQCQILTRVLPTSSSNDVFLRMHQDVDEEVQKHDAILKDEKARDQVSVVHQQLSVLTLSVLTEMISPVASMISGTSSIV